MKYELTAPHFIHNQLYPATTIIEYNGPPNPSMRPLDKEAEAAMDEYYKKNPHASLNPVHDLPMTMVKVVQSEAKEVAPVKTGESPIKTVLDPPTPEVKVIQPGTVKPLAVQPKP